MIIRTPTRTKTNSFNGQQMAFKFPSTENLRDETLDEYHLSNHHLLNDNIGKNFDEVASQILSDYTSTSNTNTNSGHSSNGYYSFANISDNTTSSPKSSTIEKRGSAVSGEFSALDVSYVRASVLEPGSVQHHDEDRKLSSRLPPSSPMEAIPEADGFASFSTAFQSIPTAANISYDIASTASSSKSLESDKIAARKLPTARLGRTPTITRVQSTASTRSSWESTRASKLKRSKAVRCKGGLLQYFILLGLTLKRQLRKVICSIRSKLARKNGGIGRRRSRVSMPDKKAAQRSRSRQEDLRTSHLKRTQRYVSNLQRSLSCKSLQPVLMSQANSAKAPSLNEAETAEIDKSPVIRNPATSLRRTNSSIKRAASVITNPHRASDSGKGDCIEHSVAADKKSIEQAQKASNRQGIVRSAGSRSLSSLARQPSIVVKNKVIPLSMYHYSIKEEEEDADEYVISTDAMRPMSPVESLNSEKSSYEDAQEDLNTSQSEEHRLLSQSLNHYLRTIISQRIMTRIQISKYQKHELPVSDLIGSLIKEYESDSTVSNLFEEHKSRNSLTDVTSEQTEEEEEKEEEEEEEEEEEQDAEAASQYSTNTSLKFTLQSPFGAANRSSHNDSLLSLPAIGVKRSLTLPIGIKV
ncbi:hypothetical protein HG536_0A07820 [Torulaspora globosa]|uniref:Altered inheritance of mitochondria protein 44 n=1 Tax=Torulaspora globosa TaxID=48254 RepID=A0A7G3ZBT1_9SACH|nr:uncharacterized protein HG536_0A07820 [Torulaspora globosa]QLL30967.1 hypothetical protein HG536_0A07820 [Torulaspora globosa]